MRIISLSLLLAVAIASPALAGAPFGIDARVANTTLLIDEVPPATAGDMTVVRVFSQLAFASPTGLFEFPDGSGRFLVMERDGSIFTFPNIADPDPMTDVDLFLDLTGPVNSLVGELGLMGFAFDPDYATNGEMYAYFAVSGGTPGPYSSIIARYTNDTPADNSVDVATEEIILTVNQPFSNHNGGTIAFGPDAMLYIAFGDGGGEPSNGNGQDTTTLLGSILRIDVHTAPADPGTMNYVIPPDNPFFGGTGPDMNTREEIFAYGFRNPFRCGFDTESGRLFCGDVGEVLREEINLVTAGGNYGWAVMEGTTCFNLANEADPLPDCDQTSLTLPLAEQTHAVATAVIGGYVYHGDAVPELRGMYIYTDFVDGNVWGLRYDGSEVTAEQTLSSGTGLFIFSMGQDAAGEVYLLEDGIYVLRPAMAGPPVDFPNQLSDIPALLAAGMGADQTAQGIFPYDPESKLWSDAAIKERFIALPGSTQIGFNATTGWVWPEETVLIKNFTLPLDFRDPIATALRIETRLLVRNGGAWHGFSYEWNAGETDATLLEASKLRAFDLIDANGDAFEYEWLYPSRNDCFRCHTDVAGRTLGINTAQMNHNFDYPASGVTDNQLRAFDHIGLFTAALPDVPDDLPRSPDSSDSGGASVEDRALSYLNANCSFCHQPGGPTPTAEDMRWLTPLDNKNMLDVVPTSGNLGLTDPRIVAPGQPDNSVLLARMEMLGANRMPPLASTIVDEDAIALIREWIQNLLSDADHWESYP